MSMFQDDDPKPSDEGKFILETELEAWFQSMQKAYPEVFTADQTLFGPIYQEQHGLGQKLMTYFDEDPNKKMKCEVRGSRMVKEHQGRGITQTPMYIVHSLDECTRGEWL
ncbi:MAG: hypothetical protein SGARI_004352, partial [Bacillariaceae sp.]